MWKKIKRAVPRKKFLIFMRSAKLFLTAFLKLERDVYIKGWFGSLGNNIIQICHAEFVLEKLSVNSSIRVPPHSFLTVQDIYLNHNLEPSYMSTFTSGLIISDLIEKHPSNSPLGGFLHRTFFYRYDTFPFTISLKDYRIILRDKVSSVLQYQADDSITEKTLVIHMRSGDVFNDKWVHAAYVQPPLSFYLKIIDEFSFEDLVIVTQEDCRNPCIYGLKQLFPQTRIKTGSLVEDIGTILSAQNLVISFSTFSLTLSFLSSNIRNLYVPQFKYDSSFKRIRFFPSIFRKLMIACEEPHIEEFSHLEFDICLAKISNYISIGNWKNEKSQRILMVNHPLEDVSLSLIRKR